MSAAQPLKCNCSSGIVALTLAMLGLLAAGGGSLKAQGSPGPLAQSCGVPPEAARPAGGERATRVFPPGQYPVQVPPASLLGASQ
jgi:hypothetical protein